METDGGINEIYNFYVGQTLQNSYNKASSAFYGQLNYARGVNYTSLAAINSISQISQGQANYYINMGAQAAALAGVAWGCRPGNLTRRAATKFAGDVNATKDSVNSQIRQVKANKQHQYQQYQAYLAYLAYLAWVVEQQKLYEKANATYLKWRNSRIALERRARLMGEIPVYNDPSRETLIRRARLMGELPAPKAYVLFNESAAMGYGHAAFAIEGSDGYLKYYSYYSDNSSAVGPGAVSTSTNRKLTHTQFFEDKGWISQRRSSSGELGGGSPWSERYTDYIGFSVTDSKRNVMIKSAEGYVSEPGGYNLLTNNCYDVVDGILASANIELESNYSKSSVNIPNYRFGATFGVIGASDYSKGDL